MIAQQQRKHYDDQFKPIQGIDLNPKKEQAPQARPGQVAGPFLPSGDRKPDLGGMEGTKKVKTDSHLIPEEMWLMMNPVRLFVE